VSEQILVLWQIRLIRIKRIKVQWYTFFYIDIKTNYQKIIITDQTKNNPQFQTNPKPIIAHLIKTVITASPQIKE
jgi:hypothetical protein